jgi:hypothetical protein
MDSYIQFCLNQYPGFYVNVTQIQELGGVAERHQFRLLDDFNKIILLYAR